MNIRHTWWETAYGATYTAKRAIRAARLAHHLGAYLTPTEALQLQLRVEEGLFALRERRRNGRH